MPTSKEIKDFAKSKYYGINPTPKTKPTHGKLVLLKYNREQVLFENEPFALLQSRKSEMVRIGQFLASELKIKY